MHCAASLYHIASIPPCCLPICRVAKEVESGKVKKRQLHSGPERTGATRKEE